MNTTLFPKGIKKVESFTTKGTFYDVNQDEETCTCPAFMRSNKCKHLDFVKTGVKPIVLKNKNSKKIDISFSLTQSLLQKAIRRNRSDVVVKAIKEMLIQNENKTLRRFLVIIPEDAIIHYNYGKIGTLYKDGVGNKRPMTDNEKDMLVKTAFDVGDIKTRDMWIDFDEEHNENEEVNEAKRNKDYYISCYQKIDYECQEILEAIKYRAMAGGMKGDQIMLWSTYYLWLKRFVEKEWNIERIKELYNKNTITFENVKPLKREDILLEAADFHCTPLLKILMRKKYVNVMLDRYDPKLKNVDYKTRENELGGILWRQHSSINLKKEIDTKKIKDWYVKADGKLKDRELEIKFYEFIKPEVYNIARWFIKKTVNL